MPREAERGGFGAPQRSPEELARVLARMAAATEDPIPRRLRRRAASDVEGSDDPQRAPREPSHAAHPGLVEGPDQRRD